MLQLALKTSIDSDSQQFLLGIMEFRNTARADGMSPEQIVFWSRIRTRGQSHNYPLELEELHLLVRIASPDTELKVSAREIHCDTLKHFHNVYATLEATAMPPYQDINQVGHFWFKFVQKFLFFASFKANFDLEMFSCPPTVKDSLPRKHNFLMNRELML